MRLLILMLLILISTGPAYTARVVPCPDLEKPTTILVDREQIFINDGAVIYIYSETDFSLQKKFGKSGEGPGEFKITPRFSRGGVTIDVQPEFLLIGSVGRISFFTRDGIYKNEIQTPYFWEVKTLEKQFVMLKSGRNNNTGTFTLSFYDRELQKGTVIYEPKSYTFGKKINPITFSKLPTFQVTQDKIIISGDEDNIYIFNSKGEKIGAINPDYEKTKVTETQINRYKKLFSTTLPYKFFYLRNEALMEYPDYFPRIRHFTASGNRVYIATYKENQGKREFVVYDLNGKLQERIMLALPETDPVYLDPYTIKNGKFYNLVENPDTDEWELHIATIE